MHSCSCHHAVQFYESQSFLKEKLLEYFTPKLQRGEAVVMVATADLLGSLTEKLNELMDVGQMISSSQLVLVDVNEALDRFVKDDEIDPSQFQYFITSLFNRLKANFSTIHFFGEMVDKLMQRGLKYQAVELEMLWNTVAAQHRLSMFCAYDLNNISDPDQDDTFQVICDLHSHVQPAEGIMEENEMVKMSRITNLQRLHKSFQRERQLRYETERLLDSFQTMRQELIDLAGHELKNPLTALKLQNWIIRTTLEGTQIPEGLISVRKSAERAETQVMRMTSLLDTMLMRLESVNHQVILPSKNIG